MSKRVNDLREFERLEEAEKAFAHVLDLAPDHMPALVGLGHLARQSGDRERSLNYFERAMPANGSF